MPETKCPDCRCPLDCGPCNCRATTGPHRRKCKLRCTSTARRRVFSNARRSPAAPQCREANAAVIGEQCAWDEWINSSVRDNYQVDLCHTVGVATLASPPGSVKTSEVIMLGLPTRGKTPKAKIRQWQWPCLQCTTIVRAGSRMPVQIPGRLR